MALCSLPSNTDLRILFLNSFLGLLLRTPVSPTFRARLADIKKILLLRPYEMSKLLPSIACALEIVPVVQSRIPITPLGTFVLAGALML